MTEGDFTTVPVDHIVVDRGNRQRRELKNIEELALSIRNVGLLNPIIIGAEDFKLVAGERRLTAVKRLGWTHVPVQFRENLDESTLQLIELEENIKRVNLTWQEECDAIMRYHELQLKQDESWTQAQTAEIMGLSGNDISERINIAKAIKSGDDRVTQAPKYSVARGIVRRSTERAKAADLDNIVASVAPKVAEKKQEEKKQVPLLHADFTEWAPKYNGPKFNFIHCDFPYGVNADKMDQGAGAAYGGYEDSEDVYWNLLQTLRGAMDNVISDSAHLMFWFSMDYYHPTLIALEKMGWRVNNFPLIWFKTDNTGILPDPNRGPRRVYETAFMASRGDRKIVQAVGNATGAPGRKPEDAIHMSQKSESMLSHFMRMFVDDTTTMLDPTCGSGSAVRVADRLGAAKVLGLERDQEFYERARDAYHRD